MSLQLRHNLVALAYNANYQQASVAIGGRMSDGKNLNIKLVGKVAMDRSATVAQDLSERTFCMEEHTAVEHVPHFRVYLLGVSREDFVYDLGRHVDASLHGMRGGDFQFGNGQGMTGL